MRKLVSIFVLLFICAQAFGDMVFEMSEHSLTYNGMRIDPKSVFSICSNMVAKIGFAPKIPVVIIVPSANVKVDEVFSVVESARRAGFSRYVIIDNNMESHPLLVNDETSDSTSSFTFGSGGAFMPIDSQTGIPVPYFVATVLVLTFIFTTILVAQKKDAKVRKSHTCLIEQAERFLQKPNKD